MITCRIGIQRQRQIRTRFQVDVIRLIGNRIQSCTSDTPAAVRPHVIVILHKVIGIAIP